MQIMLVEDDYHERELAYKDLRQAFECSEVMQIPTAGLFLITAVGSLPRLYGTDIIVMEHHLPLTEIGESQKALEADLMQLDRMFPDVVKDWHHQQAGERLIRWLREKKVRVPVIIYTHSGENDIAEDVRRDPKVFYCEKSVEPTVLQEAIRSALAIAH